MWQVVADCGLQIRRGGMSGAATGLDFGAVMAIGAARGVDMALLSTVLPAVELAIIVGQSADEGGEVVEDA